MNLVEEFHLMNIDQRILSAISDLKWQSPTTIQQAVIPLALEKKSLNVQARTGSGKTAAFAIPIIHSILEAKMFTTEQKTLALIIAPTKELCEQIFVNTKSLCKYASKNINVLNVAQVTDVDVLKPLLAEKPDIIIGTPFKVLAQLHRKRLNLEGLVHMVVDEADLIFTFDYEKDMHELKEFLPKAPIQVILMSATLNENTKALRRSIRSGEWVRVELPEENFLPSDNQLTQYIISAEEKTKYAIFIAMIRLKLIRGKTLVFTNSIDRCYKLKIFLEEFGVKSAVLNSELPVSIRCHTVQQFNQGLYDFLLATDENETGTTIEPKKKTKYARQKDVEYGVSRGIDFQLVSNVLNFDFPLTAKRYVHRVGRTARADQMGTAISFVSSAEESLAKEVANLLTNKSADSETGPGTSNSSVEDVFKPYQFRMSEVEGFRYRSADIVAKISRKRIREVRLKEIKTEILNSERLKGYFEDHSADLTALRHDRSTTTRPLTHLKDVPEYMVPKSLQVLMKGSNLRHRNRRRFQISKQQSEKSRKHLTALERNQGDALEGPRSDIKMGRLRSHKIKMALARNPAKLAQIKTQLARRRKNANPLYSFGKKKASSKGSK